MKTIKKILFITDNFPPEVNAPATRTYEHAREWVLKGYEVVVITCVPNFPKGQIFQGYKNKFLQREFIDGIKVIRVWSYIAPNAGFFKRTLDYISFAFMSFLVGVFIQKDIIIATSPQFFTAIAGNWLASFNGKPWIMEVRDLWPESIVAVGALQNEFVLKRLQKLELKLYHSANKLVVVTDSFKYQIAKRGVDENKIYIHKNGVMLDFFQPRKKDIDLMSAHPQFSDKFIFAYIGTHGMASGLSMIINALSKIEQEIPSAHFLFIGEGSEKESLMNQANHLSLTNITFLPLVPKNEVVRYLSLMDVGLVNLKKSETFKSVIPSKIFEAAALQKPILLGLEGETKNLIETYNSGCCFEPENEKDFIEKCHVIMEKNRYKEYQIGCQRLAESFDRKRIALQMLGTIIGEHNDAY